MVKLKTHWTADRVVGGFRYARGTKPVGSLLLGLYDANGKLDYAGFTSAISDAERPALTALLEALIDGDGFTDDAPRGPSRWSMDRSAAWQKLRPELVVEVSYDQVTDGRFRHGTMLVRCWLDEAPGSARPSRSVRSCCRGKLVDGSWRHTLAGRRVRSA